MRHRREMNDVVYEVDKQKYDKVVNAGDIQSNGVLCFSVDVTRDTDIEALVASFLLTSAAMMGMAPHCIVKIFSARVMDDTLCIAIENAIRGLSSGEFSSLANTQNWLALVSGHCDIEDSIKTRIQATARSVACFDNSNRGLLHEPADTVFKVWEPGDALSHIQIVRREPDSQEVEITLGKLSFRRHWNQEYQNSAAQAFFNKTGPFVLLEADATDNQVFFKQWLMFIDALVANG